MNCEKCSDKGIQRDDNSTRSAQVYCDCPLGEAFKAVEDVKAIAAATEKLASDHDKLLRICVSMVMAHGGAIKLHGMQLDAAELMKLQFEVKQPFLEIRAVPRDEEVKKAIESRIVLATTMPPKVKL